MSEQQTEYRQIVKATSIFGGVQVVNILISLIRGKFVAILIGPAGMGIFGMLTSVASLFGALTNFGIGTSAVKDIAEANAGEDKTKIESVTAAFRKLVWITGILGAILLIVLSPWVSQITFGNRNYTISIIWVSITLLFAQLTSGNIVLLQGLRKLKELAKANVYGSIIGLFITVPLYYYFGKDGIVPAILLTSFSTLVISIYFGKKININNIKIPMKTAFIEGKSMLIMGFVLSINGLVLMGTSYLVKIFILNIGSIEDVGFYNAGFAIVNGYVGMIFTAMLTDYYPRLSSVANDNKLCIQTVNQQADIAILILAPIIIIFNILIQVIVIILLSSKFLAITDMIRWAMLGVFFKAASWPVGFIFVPKGNSRLFLFSELTANAYMLLFNILGYKYFGLQGMGISFLISFIVYLIQVYFLAKIKYHFSFTPSFYRIFIFQLSIAIVSFIIAKFMKGISLYSIGIILITISLIYSYIELDKRLNLKSLILSLKQTGKIK